MAKTFRSHGATSASCQIGAQPLPKSTSAQFVIIEKTRHAPRLFQEKKTELAPGGRVSGQEPRASRDKFDCKMRRAWFGGSMKCAGTILFLALAIQLCAGGRATMTDDQIRAKAQERIENGQTVGIVIGIIDENGPRVFAFGKTARKNGKDVDAETIFEIGSVTKTFTCLLLSDMAQRGEVSLDDPISKYAPPGAKLPTRNGKEITLRDLATQSSGLPRMPANFDPKDPENPYADYTAEKLWAFLATCNLDRDIGEKYEYSNLGMGLLGTLLARRAGTNYETLLTERVLRPLGMTSTALTLTPELRARFAEGHDAALQRNHPWDFDALAGCGAIRSSVNDMMKYLAAAMGETTNALGPAFKAAEEPARATTIPGTRIGLGWHITERNGHRITWHNGQTGGYASCVAFDPTNKVGAVVLVNASVGMDRFALSLVAPEAKPAGPSVAGTNAPLHLDAEKLKRFAGIYELAPGVNINVRPDDVHLMAQVTGQQYYEIFPKSETNFFYKVVEAQVTFNGDAEGKIVSLTLHQNGADSVARKTSDEPPAARKEITVDAKLMDGYEGEYALAPGAVFTIRRDGDRLLAKLTGQPFLQIFPESETNFFYKVVDAQISFVKGDDGKTKALVLHQNGIDQTAPKSK